MRRPAVWLDAHPYTCAFVVLKQKSRGPSAQRHLAHLTDTYADYDTVTVLFAIVTPRK
jgi:hypothetical protein